MRPRAGAGIVIMIAFMLYIAWPLHAAPGPDELYAKGRYKEAALAYQKLDMENPGDLRYRYDRGCADFQAGNLDEAKAAFESVARRADNNDMRFRALYNLGNTSYKQNDFAAARDYYREALKARPDDADAGHNLELALKALKKQQEEKEKQKQQAGDGKQKEDKSQGKEGGQGKDQKPGQDSGQQGQGQQQGKSRGQDSQKQPGDQNGKQDQSGGRSGKSGQQKEPGTGTQGRPQEGKQDLSGELKGRNMQSMQGSGSQGQSQAQDSAAMMERRKAEALLDNINEDRARINQLQGQFRTQGGRGAAGSGKEW